jgi:hypothetical protein
VRAAVRLKDQHAARSTRSSPASPTRSSEPCEDLLERLRASRAVHMDETGWRTAGQRRALWGIFDERHAYLHVAADRHEDHAKSCSPTPRRS